MNERLIYLLEQVSRQKASLAELQELRRIIGNDEAGQVVQQLNAFYANAAPHAGGYDHAYWDAVADEVLAADKLPEPLMQRGRIRLLPRAGWWAAAAAVLVCVTVGIYFFMSSPKQPVEIAAKDDRPAVMLTLADGSRVALDSLRDGRIASQGGAMIVKEKGQLSYKDAGGAAAVSYNTIATPRGSRYQVMLEDGSKVWLNAASSLRYPVAFSKGPREVELSGEGYFEVAADASRPFLVKVNGMQVQVLGTSFNINAYSDEQVIRTTLVHGRVLTKAEGKEMLLLPGEQSLYEPHAAAFIKQPVNTANYTTWKEGNLYLEDATLSTIAHYLERTFNYDLKFADPSLENQRFTLDVRQPGDIREVLDHISRTAGQLHFRIQGRTIWIEKSM